MLLSVGVESTTPESMALHGKGWNRPDAHDAAIRAIRAHGIEVSTEMMVGLEGDDAGVFDRTYDFLMRNEIAVPRIHIVTPVPGTPLWQRLEREGRIVCRDFSRYTGGRIVFRPRTMPAEQIEREYWALYRRLFSLRAIGHRVAHNPAGLGPFMRAFTIGVNFHYRGHIRRGIPPGIV